MKSIEKSEFIKIIENKEIYSNIFVYMDFFKEAVKTMRKMKEDYGVPVNKIVEVTITPYWPFTKQLITVFEYMAKCKLNLQQNFTIEC